MHISFYLDLWLDLRLDFAESIAVYSYLFIIIDCVPSDVRVLFSE